MSASFLSRALRTLPAQDDRHTRTQNGSRADSPDDFLWLDCNMANGPGGILWLDGGQANGPDGIPLQDGVHAYGPVFLPEDLEIWWTAGCTSLCRKELGRKAQWSSPEDRAGTEELCWLSGPRGKATELGVDLEVWRLAELGPYSGPDHSVKMQGPKRSRW